MKKVLLCILILSFWACEDDEPANEGPEVTVTSFSGTIVFEDMELVTNGRLFIAGSESTLFGSRARDGVILTIDDGTFDFTFETVEPITRFSIAISILQDNSLINSFGFANGLECIPGDCGNFLPGQNHEFILVVPCTEDDCIFFPPG